MRGELPCKNFYAEEKNAGIFNGDTGLRAPGIGS